MRHNIQAANMTLSIVSSISDIVSWFLQCSELGVPSYLARKLQSLLYLAQAGYEGWHDGRSPMLSNFVVRETCPRDSNRIIRLGVRVSMAYQRKSWCSSNAYGAFTVCAR